MKNKGFTLVEIMIVVVIIGLLASMFMSSCQGGWSTGTMLGAPVNSVTARVISKHVDYSRHNESHYMVSTTSGTFEVQNGFLLDMWNADEVYGQIEPGHTYTFHTRGVKVVNAFMQEYPYILSAQESK